MLLDDLRVKKDAIVALGHEFGARHIRVFGSVARCEERPDSDIDFLVEFPKLRWKSHCRGLYQLPVAA